MKLHRLCFSLVLGLATSCTAQRPQPKQEKIGDGTLIQVLPPDRIPSIDDPVFVPDGVGSFIGLNI